MEITNLAGTKKLFRMTLERLNRGRVANFFEYGQGLRLNFAYKRVTFMVFVTRRLCYEPGTFWSFVAGRPDRAV